MKFYRQMLDRRMEEMEKGCGILRVPQPRGLHLRLPGKPFHATPEFFFQEAGTTRFLLPERTLTAGPREAALMPSGMPHGEEWTGSGFLNVIVMFQEEGYSLHLGYFEDCLRCGPFDRFYASGRDDIVRYAREITATSSTRAGKQVRRGLYLACLGLLREGLASGAVTNDQKNPLLQRCLDLIDVHFARIDFSVTWLAHEIGCSADHLSRLFRQQMGSRLVSFIHRKRIEYASYLLRESDLNIAETAWACGFRQPSYFNRIFRAHTGRKPNQLRKGNAANHALAAAHSVSSG